MKSIWQDTVINLVQSLEREDGSATDKLTVKMIDAKTHREIVAAGKEDQDVIYRALVKEGAGLTDKEVKQLAYPDYQSLIEAVELAYGRPASFWFERLAEPDQKDGVADQFAQIDWFPLLLPIETADDVIDRITLKFPTVAAVDVMDKQPEDKQNAFIKMQCTGLSEAELDGISAPDDWELQERVTDFLSQTGSFFSAKKT